MNIRRPIFWCTVVVVALVALILWHGTTSTTKPSSKASVETNGEASSASGPGQTAGNAFTSTVTATVSASTANPAASVTPDKGAQIKEGLAKLNDIGIDFNGRLEDQHGNAVANTTIDASVRIYNGSRSTVDHFSVVSDANGLFRVKHGNGESLSLMPHKAGYVFAMTKTSFNYSYMYPDHFTPDPNNPTVIKMLKLEGAEPLVSINKEYKIPHTDKPIYFDLMAGKIVPEGGDVKIIVNRPSGEISEQHPQKWHIDFEVVNGGFIETSDKEWGVTFAAPESGYRPSGTFGNNNGIGALDKAFFIRSRNGQAYSKLGFSLGINNKPDGLMYITFSGFANTNGSRNWEATAPQ